jgi:hypothetical protein
VNIWDDAEERGRASGDTWVPGHELLDEINTTLKTYVVFPNDHASVAYTLWLAATHAQPAWEHATRFVFKSPIKRCGKTRAQEIGRELAHAPISTVNISTAALVHSIDEKDPPTLFVDEADTIFARKKGEAREGSEEVRGILNAGHSHGWPYIRWDIKKREREECDTFAMALLSGIGDLPDTIEDRAVIVAMRRRAPGEIVTAFRRRRVVPVLHSLRARLHTWVAELDGLDVAEPQLPVEDREADTWEPLMAIADAAGGHWPVTARTACRALCGASNSDDGTAGERLLADLHDIWKKDEEHLPTATILERLIEIDEAPWSDWYGKPLAARGLARLLRPYGIASRNVRVGADTLKGYVRADLADAWARYTHPSATSATAPQDAETPPPTSGDECGGSVADSDSVSATWSDQHEWADVADVADVADGHVDGAIDGRPLTYDEALALLEDELNATSEEDE